MNDQVALSTLRGQVKTVTDLDAPVLLCSTSRHQILNVNASISHICVYSSLLVKKKKGTMANQSVMSLRNILIFMTAGWMSGLGKHRDSPLTATLMPRLPPLFFSSIISRSPVFKLMMDGDLEHTS